jgi:hypothetical protein
MHTPAAAQRLFRKPPKKARWSAAVLALTLLLNGCAAYEPYEYQNDRDMMQGPGLFSGEDGVFTIFGKKDRPSPENAADASAEEEDSNGGEAP